MEKQNRIRPSKRRLIQVYAALLYNAHIKGFISGEIYKGDAKFACTPGLNCYSCPGAVASCPLGALQNALAYSGKSVGFYVFGILLLYGIIFGRTICGYLCPVGFLQELLHKIPTPKIHKSRRTRGLSYLKFFILVFFVIVIPVWYGFFKDMTVPGFCKYICPAGTSEGAVALLSNTENEEYFGMLGFIFTWKFILLMLIVLLSIFCYRSFCRFICPLGALYGLFNRWNIVGVKVDGSRCNGCGACVKNCEMDVLRVGDHECINCGICIDVCSQKAISLKAGRITLKAHSETIKENGKKTGILERILWISALAVLLYAFYMFNKSEPSDEKQNQNKEIEESAVKTGYDVGCILPDFEIECLNGESFSIGSSKGKPVFINLWATYCGPCVKELPIFEEFVRKHEGDISFIAVHSSLIDDDPEEFIEKSGLSLAFAIDTDDDSVWNAVGGNSTIPQTIVLDRNGVVIYNKRGSIDMDMLESLYEKAGGKPG